jgi:hypothetical protein
VLDRGGEFGAHHCGVPPAAPRYYFLITAFHLSGDSQRRNMRRRYEEREP